MTNCADWISSLSQTTSERVITHAFWEGLDTDIEDYCKAYNTEHKAHLLSVTQDGNLLSISYNEYLLRILIDVRTGRILYQFVTPKLAIFDPESHGITASGEVFLDVKTNFSFVTTSKPAINLVAGMQESPAWPNHDRLAQYLLQKLVSPDLADQRFVGAEA